VTHSSLAGSIEELRFSHIPAEPAAVHRRPTDLGELTLGRKTFRLLERLGSSDRERYRALDPLAGPRGDLRAIHVLPATPEVKQHLDVLQRLADLRNANVPFLVEYHRQGEKTYLVLAWVKGTPLDERVTRIREGRDEPFSAFTACKLIRGLAHGLTQLHDRWNVNHGDIKPANLILAPGGRSLATIDFGSAWLSERTMTRDPGDGVSGVYTAPELLMGGIPSARSDQFSVSVVWYEMLTRELPYDGVGGKAGLPTYRTTLEGKLIPPSELAKNAGHVPRGLWKQIDSAVCQGLALDPDRRFPSRRPWLDALDQVQDEFRRRGTLRGWNLKVVDFLTRRVSPRAPF